MRFELRNREFFKKTLIIMAPVVLQQLISIGINFFDNIMVGGFGETQIAAAAFANQFYSVFQFICMGLGSGAIVMSSQFWGRRELEPMRVVSAIAMRVTVACCAAFLILGAVFPDAVLRVFTNDSDIVRAGTPYLRLIALTFLPNGLASTATYLLRSVGKVKIPLIGSAGAFVLNIFFNWVFIFGKLGAPRMEIVGAAVGTLIARAFEFFFVFGFFILKEKDFAFRIKHFLLPGKSLRRQYIKFSIPVLISDALLGVSLALCSVILGHIGGSISAASSIVNSAVQVTNVLNFGMSGASAVIVGNTIGSGDIPKAKREANTYVLLAFLFGIFIVAPLLLLEKPYFSLYTITAETYSSAHGMLLCTCLMMPLQTIAYITSKGILRGGGDTRFLLVWDSSMIWFVSIPLGALAGLVWHMSPVWVYFFLRVEYPLKGVICLIRFWSGKWIKEVRSTDKKLS